MASEATRGVEMLRDKWKSVGTVLDGFKEVPNNWSRLDSVLDHLKSSADDMYKGFEEAKVVKFSTHLAVFDSAVEKLESAIDEIQKIESVVKDLKDRVEKLQNGTDAMSNRGREEEAQKKEK